MRVGKYGNADDSDADLKEKKDGIRFAAVIRCVHATDDALYVFDEANLSLSKILLKYAAEETVPLP
jgi:hypothetical protein